MSDRLDVAILGGGLAGQTLARHLQRTHPDLSVALFERSVDTDYKVGESTVEIFSSYMIRRLGLSTYLYEQQLPKNGLRFFFDRPGRDVPLEQMSEIGSSGLPFHPSFQLDRARLEADLRAMNREQGVQLFEGVRASRVELDPAGGVHRFEAIGDASTRSVSCRWLIDATGRARLLAKANDLAVPCTDHSLGAVWGRFRGVRDIDDVPPDSDGAEFAARFRHTSRRLSTIHFCYPGYWIWFIPLRGGLTSVGVVADDEHFQPRLRKREGFLDFLREHRAVRDQIVDAELIDIGSYGQLAFGTRRFFSADRWGLVGEAAAFTDPFYSPGSDFIALENDFLVDLIGRGAAGEDVAERVDLYDRYMQFRYQANLRLYRGLYGVLGSFDVFRLKWEFDMTNYYHLWVQSYMRDQHLDASWLRNELANESAVLGILDQFAAFFRRIEAQLAARGELARGNVGHVAEGLDFFEDPAVVGTQRSNAEVQLALMRGFGEVRSKAYALLGTEPASAGRSLRAYASGEALA